MASNLRFVFGKGRPPSSALLLQRTLRQQKLGTRAYKASTSRDRSPRPYNPKRYGTTPDHGALKKELPQREINFVTEPDHLGPPLMILKAGKSRLFYEGAPTIYGGAVDKIISAKLPVTGEAMLVLDANMKQVCWGVFNSVSMFCLRILQWRNEMGSASITELDLGSIITARIQAAVEMRQNIGLPSESTTVYRLVNSEGDRLSGLIVDVYGKCAVASSSAAWIEANKEAVIAALKTQAGMEEVVWRPALEMLKLEGITLHSTAEPALQAGGEEGGPQTEAEPAASSSRHQNVMENGVAYKVDLRHGQKTGFYADQRDSRGLIKALSCGKRVLDLCTYTGGFALAAAAGGASHVTGVDSSASAIRLAEENATLPQGNGAAHFEHMEVEPFMRQAALEGRLWDIVVLDPPKLAPNRRALERAKQKYVKLNVAAMRLVTRGGLLMTCSCSGAVAQADGLLPMVKEAAAQVGRLPTLLRSAGAALDHPLDPSYPEGQYLSNLLIRLN